MSRRIIFVRSGGGMPGLDIHSGIWLALQEAGIHPTEVHGTSAGALISAMQAAGKGASFCASLVNSLSDSDIRRERRAWKLRIPWLDHFLENAPIRALLESVLDKGWSGNTIPLHAWAARLHDGEAVNVAHPSLSPSPALAALASMSISGVFPPVELLDGHHYVDGGVRRYLPLPHDWREADQVWLLLASGRPRDYKRTRGILTALMRNIDYLMLDQLTETLARVRGAPNVRVIWPRLNITQGALHFDHRLICAAYEQAREAIAKGPP